MNENATADDTATSPDDEIAGFKTDQVEGEAPTCLKCGKECAHQFSTDPKSVDAGLVPGFTITACLDCDRWLKFGDEPIRQLSPAMIGELNPWTAYFLGTMTKAIDKSLVNARLKRVLAAIKKDPDGVFDMLLKLGDREPKPEKP